MIRAWASPRANFDVGEPRPGVTVFFRDTDFPEAIEGRVLSLPMAVRLHEMLGQVIQMTAGEQVSREEPDDG